MLTAGHRAKDLVQQILTFSRQTECERTPIQVHLLIKEVLDLLRAALPSSITIQPIIGPMPEPYWPTQRRYTRSYSISARMRPMRCASLAASSRYSWSLLTCRLTVPPAPQFSGQDRMCD